MSTIEQVNDDKLQKISKVVVDEKTPLDALRRLVRESPNPVTQIEAIYEMAQRAQPQDP